MAQHKRTDSKDVPWYNGDIGVKLGPKAREILQGYAKIPSSELESHVSVIVSLSLSTVLISPPFHHQ
jgi:hypothetical protein